jgi:transposase
LIGPIHSTQEYAESRVKEYYIGYHMLKEGTTYRELGGNYFDKRNLLRTTRRLVKRLEALGHRVILEPTQSPFQSSDCPQVFSREAITLRTPVSSAVAIC